MIVNNVDLECVAVKPEQYPTTEYPEIAFAGKSNVGKSSLINTMMNRRAYARTSQTPGKTRTINFYNIESKLYFVDLPGYGYSKASKSESEKWGAMIEKYLLGRNQLKMIALLVDIRHEPSANDRLMSDWLRHYGYKLVTIATKADKLSRQQAAKSLKTITKSLNFGKDDIIIPFSKETKQGRDELWRVIETQADISEV